MIWTEEVMSDLRQLLSEGKSAAQIGAIFGITRHSVIGKVRRTPGLFLNGYTARPKNDVVVQQKLAAKRRRPVIHPTPSMETPVIGVTMLELAPSQCKWPVNDAEKHELHLFCAEETNGKTYCAHHARRVYYSGPRQSSNYSKQHRLPQP